MVKNAGGNKTKRGARKHTFAPQNKQTRLSKEDGEIYAVVSKMLGGSNCEVMCSDGNTRLCVIRNMDTIFSLPYRLVFGMLQAHGTQIFSLTSHGRSHKMAGIVTGGN